METYKELKERQQKEFNEFPLGFAFSDIAFKTMMERWGLTENDTGNVQDTLDVLGYTVADIEKDSRLKKGFYKAKKQIMNDEGAIWQ